MLTDIASLRTCEHDWPLMWLDVHLGESASVSSPPTVKFSTKIRIASFRLASRSKCEDRSLRMRARTDFRNSGGPAGLIYGFVIIWLGNFSVFVCIGELASAVPTAGGQYHWVSLLAPRSNKKFFSYVTGMYVL